MTNIDILKQATVNNARALQIDHITGTIKSGLAADLILVPGRPDEDISVVYQKPSWCHNGDSAEM